MVHLFRGWGRRSKRRSVFLPRKLSKVSGTAMPHLFSLISISTAHYSVAPFFRSRAAEKEDHKHRRERRAEQTERDETRGRTIDGYISGLHRRSQERQMAKATPCHMRKDDMTFQEDLLPRKVWWKGGSVSVSQSMPSPQSVSPTTLTIERRRQKDPHRALKLRVALHRKQKGQASSSRAEPHSTCTCRRPSRR